MTSSLLLNAPEIELLRALLTFGARFLVIGGHAVIFHGYLRPAKDLDLFVDAAADNPGKMISALTSVSVHHPDMTAARLAKPNQQIRIDGMYNAELLTSVAGLSFELAYRDRVVSQEATLQVPVVSREDLLRSKRKLGRPQDLEDVAALLKVGA
jgi:hypothetical protein